MWPKGAFAIYLYAGELTAQRAVVITVPAEWALI